MAQARKFLFDTAFESAGAQREQKPKPQFTEADLAAARGEGQQAGFAMGREQAMRETARRVADALEAAAEALARIDVAQARMVGEIRADAARLALAIAAKLAPALIARRPLEEIEAVISDCLAQLPAEPRVAVRVAEALVEPLAERIDGIVRRTGFSGAVVLLGEPELAPGDARVEWADGGAERSLQRTLDAVTETVERYCRIQQEAPPRPAEVPAPAAVAPDDDDPLGDGLPALAR
jgi:flagellar assembly protein FliH